MMTTIETDVLVVGGGPCGLMLANELGRRGIPLLLVDAKPSTAFNPQANATQARTMEHFRRLGFADEVRALGLPADHPTDIAYFTRYTGWELARLSLPTAAQAVRDVKKMGGSWSAAELPHRVSQKFVEAVLRRHAEQHAGNDVRYGWRMVEFTDRGDCVEAVVAPVDGGAPAVKVKAQYLVGADGPRSGVRSALGIAWGGATGVKRDFMGGQMFAVYLRAPGFYDALPHPRAWMYVTVNPQRRAFMASVDGRSEFAFHAALHEGENADGWGEAEARRVFAEAMGCELPIEVLSVDGSGVQFSGADFSGTRHFLSSDRVAAGVTAGPALLMVRPELLTLVGKDDLADAAQPDAALSARVTEMFGKGGTIQYRARSEAGTDLVIEIPGTASAPVGFDDRINLGWRQQDAFVMPVSA